MTLGAISASLSSAAPQPEVEVELRALLNNLLYGYQRGHISLAALTRRIKYMVTAFPTFPTHDHSALLIAHLESLKAFGEADHYERPGQLNSSLDVPAVSIHASEDGSLGDYWLGRRVSPMTIVHEFDNDACIGTVGAPGRALWITPLSGRIQMICEEARDPNCSGPARAELARAAVGLLGLSHFRPKDDVFAMVTKKTIGEIFFDHPDTNLPRRPVGSTAVEARGHRRFRPWPIDAFTDHYGRTYELDGSIRAASAPPGYHGAPESVCIALDIKEFASCIYIGPLTSLDFDDEASDYVTDIDASRSTQELLADLAGVTGQ